MRAFLMIVALSFAASPILSASGLPDLTGVNRIVVWEAGQADHPAAFAVISDPKAISRIVYLVSEAGSAWGSTPNKWASVYLLLEFDRSSTTIAQVYLAHRVLVFGDGRDRYSKEIDVETERELARLATWPTPKE